MAAGQAVAIVDPGYMVAVNTSFTRPANVTAYTAGDVITDGVPSILTFTGAARIQGGSGYIVRALLRTDQTTNVSAYRLHLYHTAPAAIADNAPMTVLWADNGKYVGSIDFAAMAGEPGTNTAAQTQVANLKVPFICDATDQNLYGILEVITAGFTPASGQNFFVELWSDQY